MKRITNIDMETNCKHLETALRRFMKQYPGHEEWQECFQWMYDNNVEFYSDNVFADGTYNAQWLYALHLIADTNYYYIALIERRQKHSKRRETKTMTNEKIKAILNAHYIECAESKDRIYALEKWLDTKTGCFEQELTDVTNWSKKQLLDWLGY